MLQLTVTVSAGQAEWVADFLTESGALAVILQDALDQPLFQEELHATPLWQQTKIQALFADDFVLDELINTLKHQLSSGVDCQIQILVEENWVQKTQQNFPARCFADKLWVAPSGAVLRINPGLGFGTGAHPTTALCLQWLAEQADLTQKTVIDYGCGSGILGLAALALGAQTVWAVDHDPQALLATKNNAELNHFPSGSLNIVLPEQLPMLQAEMILANILANPLCELADKLISCLAPQGQLVLSGFYAEEIDRITQAYTPTLKLISTEIQENWARLVFFNAG